MPAIGVHVPVTLTSIRDSVFNRLPSTPFRFGVVLVAHIVLIAVSSVSALWLRFDGAVPVEYAVAYPGLLLALLAVRLPIFFAFGLFGSLWRYVGVWDLWRIVLASAASSAVLHAFQVLGWVVRFPRSVAVIDFVLLVCLVGGARLVWRTVPLRLSRPSNSRRVLIVGAGDAGEMIVREMKKGGQYTPVGFVDDDPTKKGCTIHGVTVLGSRWDLPRIVAATQPQEVLVAIPSASPAFIRSVVERLDTPSLPITTLPSLSELVNATVEIRQIRPLVIEDLLPRGQVVWDSASVRQIVKGKRVLVTGAGGSIGSELCRQIARHEPERLVLFERYENGLYEVGNDLSGVGSRIAAIVGDVTDARRVDSVFREHRPDLVFHAAAHKHVPLMEANPCEAVKNNVIGTHTLAEAARRHQVERFVMISTDKAANPSSVMGATKRVAELIVQASGLYAGTRFVTVRFGNVLGSNGSVIPRMLEQIRNGGPVTVTHPEIRRYFMLIPEAVQLVLQAAVLANDRETFVLDMGEQVRILDVARNLIRLSGFVPDRDIPITFTGLRPGEKLREELTGAGEVLDATSNEKIFKVRSPSPMNPSALAAVLSSLVRAAVEGDDAAVVMELRRVVPTFTPEPAVEPETAGPRSLAVAASAGGVFPRSVASASPSPTR